MSVGIRQNIKASTRYILVSYKLKQHRTWLDEECTKIIRSKEVHEVAILVEPKPNKCR
jgi:hypothetical protein